MKPLQKLSVDTYQSFYEKALTKGARAAKLAGTITHRQERRSKSGNKFAFVGFSDPTGQFETICFSDTLAACRELLEPGNAVIARVEADVEGEEVKLRLQGVEMLEQGGVTDGDGPRNLRARCKATGVHRPAPDQWRTGARAAGDADGPGREVHVSLGNKFTVTRR